MSRNVTDFIANSYSDLFTWVKPRKQSLKCQNKYLQIIVYITLQFIVAQAVEGESQTDKPYLYQES